MTTDEETEQQVEASRAGTRRGPRSQLPPTTHPWMSSHQGTQAAHRVVMGRAMVSEDTEGTKEAEMRQELSLGTACPLSAHLAQCAWEPQEALWNGAGLAWGWVGR